VTMPIEIIHKCSQCFFSDAVCSSCNFSLQFFKYMSIIPVDTILQKFPSETITGIWMWWGQWPRPSNSKLFWIPIRDKSIMKMLLEKCSYSLLWLEELYKVVLKKCQILFSINCVIQKDWSNNSSRWNKAQQCECCWSTCMTVKGFSPHHTSTFCLFMPLFRGKCTSTVYQMW
jgi:hypothetical protein